MRFIATRRFEEAYQLLPDGLRREVRKALKLLADNPGRPSLHLKRIQGTAAIWEARVDKGCRMTMEIHSDCFVLRNVGKHDETLDRP